MTAVQIRQEIVTLVQRLPDSKLPDVFDFVRDLVDDVCQASWFEAQSHSQAYLDWVGAENDIYDEVFTDVAR